LKKRVKKQKPVYIPTYVGVPETDENRFSVFDFAVKTLMVCLAASGLCVTLAQIYTIPVSFAETFTLCFFMTALFNILFLMLKKRAAYPLIALFSLLFLNFRDTVKNLSVFSDYFLHTLDSRLLDTARYASRSYKALTQSSSYTRRIEAAFLLICVIICLIMTVGSRAKFVGTLLITAALTLIPAFAAEIAGYVPGMELFLAGVFGIYAVLASSSGVRNSRAAAGVTKKKEPFYKVYPGTPPCFYRYGRNALITSGITVIACFIAAGIFTRAVKIDYEKIINGFSDLTVEIPYGVEKFFKYNFGEINTNGYFGGTEISSGITPGISLGRPPRGDTPVIRVTLEDNSEKIYLRGGIGVDFLGKGWSTEQDSKEFRELNKFLKNFTPEEEYDVFRKNITAHGYDYSAYMGVQWVRIEYMARKKFALLPTQPYDFDYKNSDKYYWELDTILKPKGRFDTFECDCIYPRLSNVWFDALYSALSDDYTYGEKPVRTDYDTYAEYVGKVYRNVPDNEHDNIMELLGDIGITFGNYGRINLNVPPGSTVYSYYGIMQYVCNYLKSNYEYSLSVDNEAGDNTYLGNFLFDTRKGHCSLYATAMTLAARQLGLPARYVTGFVVSGKGTEGDSGYEYELSERDLHAWTEVYFDGIGWVPFDPTGGVNGAEAAATRQTTPRITAERTVTTPTAATTRTTTEPSETTAKTGGGSKTGRGNSITKAAIIAVIALIPVILAIAAAIYLNAVKKSEERRFSRFKNNRDSRAAEEMYLFMFRILAIEKIGKLTGEQPTGFALRTDSLLNKENLSLSDNMPLFEKLEFSDFDLTADEYDSLFNYVDALYGEIVRSKNVFTRILRRIELNRE